MEMVLADLVLESYRVCYQRDCLYLSAEALSTSWGDLLNSNKR